MYITLPSLIRPILMSVEIKYPPSIDTSNTDSSDESEESEEIQVTQVETPKKAETPKVETPKEAKEETPKEVKKAETPKDSSDIVQIRSICLSGFYMNPKCKYQCYKCEEIIYTSSGPEYRPDGTCKVVSYMGHIKCSKCPITTFGVYCKNPVMMSDE